MDFSALLVIIVGAGAALAVCSRLSRREARYAMLAFCLHVLAAFGQWALHTFYYGYSDGGSYATTGASLAKLLDYDFPHFAPELLKLTLHLDSNLPVEVIGQGSSSGTMAGIAAFLVFAVGPSLLALSIVTSWLSWFGLLCWYRVARDELGPRHETAALVGIMLVPSVVFWGSAFAKEALELGAFGVLGLSTYRVLRDRRLRYLPGIAFGGLGVAILKAFTLFPFVLAIGAFIYADRAWRTENVVRVRPFYLVLAGAISLGGVLALAALFPQYNADNLAETVSHHQQAWDPGNGGSNVARVGGEDTTGTQQLGLAPIALVNSLFRPFFFEARGAPAIGAAMEATLLALAALSLLGSIRSVTRALLASPFLVASAVFVVIFAFGVGLTTSNLGSLSRYRAPMMPFYATLLLVLRAHVRRTAGAVRETMPAFFEARSPVPPRAIRRRSVTPRG
jgi:hypothetical protein